MHLLVVCPLKISVSRATSQKWPAEVHGSVNGARQMPGGDAGGGGGNVGKPLSIKWWLHGSQGPVIMRTPSTRECPSQLRCRRA